LAVIVRTIIIPQRGHRREERARSIFLSGGGVIGVPEASPLLPISLTTLCATTATKAAGGH
jgi:hypothetical protein